MIRTVIICDKCGAQFAYVGSLPEKWVNRFSRQHGWSCGKQHLCHECRRKKQKADHAE